MDTNDFGHRLKQSRIFWLLAGGFALRLILAYFLPLTQRAAKRVNVAIFFQQTHSFPLTDFSATTPFSYTPLWHLLVSVPLHIYEGVIGIHRAYFLLTPVFGILTIWITYRLASHLYDHRIAIVAAAVLTFHPFFLRKNATPSIETFITFLFVLGVYLYVLYLDNDDDRYLLFAFLVGGLASLTKVYGPALLAVVFLHHLKAYKFDRITRLVGYATLGGALGSLWYLRNIYHFGHPYPREFPNAYETAPMTETIQPEWSDRIYQFPRLVSDYMGLRGIWPLFRARVPEVVFLFVIAGLLLTAILLYGYYLDRQQNRYSDLFTLWIGVFGVLLVLGVFLSGIRPKWRHVTALTPYTAILIALVYVHVVEKRSGHDYVQSVARVVLVLALVTATVQVGVWTAIQHDQFQSEQRPAIDYVDQNISADQRVFTRRPTQFGSYTARPTSFVSRSVYMPSRNINPQQPLGCQLEKNTDYLLLEPQQVAFHKEIYNYTNQTSEFQHVKTIRPSPTVLNPDTITWVIVRNVGGRSETC